MSVPEFARYINPLLAALRKLGDAGRPKQVCQMISCDHAMPCDVLEERLASGGSKFENQIAWARWYSVVTGDIDGSRRGVWMLTDKGQAAGALSDEALRQIIDETHTKTKGASAESRPEPADETADELDIEKLIGLYNSDRVAQCFLEHAASRQSPTKAKRASIGPCTSVGPTATRYLVSRSSPSSKGLKIAVAADSSLVDAAGHHASFGLSK